MQSNGSSGSGRLWLFAILGFAGIAGLTVLLLALLTNIFERKQEAREPFVRVVEVTEATLDPKVWGQNWPNEYDSYLKTALPTTTKYGGRGIGASDAGPAEQKIDRDPWLTRIFAGYAFAIDYRDRRGHSYALFDQEQTKRVTERMPYQRIGAQKVSDHWVRSPLLNLNRACQTCHAVAEAELTARVLTIQDRHHALLQRAAKATTDMLDAIVTAKKTGATEADLQAAAALHKKAQWRLDFVAAENSMGFHAPQELARILGETIDFARQGQLAADRVGRSGR